MDTYGFGYLHQDLAVLIHNSQMEEKPLTNAELEKATSRRSRKDEEGRDFQCGCGKRYLSYPALYTHIKTKHDGRQPEGTLKTGLAVPHPKRSRGKLEEEALRQLHGLADREDFAVLGQLEEGHLGCVAMGSRIKKEQLPKEIWDCYAGMLKQQECKLGVTASLDMALTVYLLNAGEYVGERVYDYYLLFARAARGCFHEHGEEIYRAYHAAKQHFPPFTGELADFPTVAEFLICHYLPESEGKEREAAIPMVELILQDFCNWLLRRKLTRLRVTLVRDYRLDVKPALPRHKATPRKDDTKEKYLAFPCSNSEELKKEAFEESEESEQEEEEEQEQPVEP